jgi:uncharacterized protein YodC (DUF2158 family)
MLLMRWRAFVHCIDDFEIKLFIVMNTFVIGDVVKLSSADVLMTINSEAANNNYVECIWFSTEGKPVRQDFHVDALEYVRSRVPNPKT